MSAHPRDVQARASAKLRAAGIASPQGDARTLLMHATGLSATGLLVADDVDESTLARYEQLIAARCAGTPLQHLTGRVWFRNVELAVGPGVFVPRPETELVAGAAIEAARSTVSPLVVELCAGSGAISAALANEVPGVRLFAVEVDPAAARWLRRNVTGNGVVVVEADMADALTELDGQVDVVVANPPYIDPAERDTLPAEVRKDPDRALFAAEQGLAAIRVVGRVARRLLRPGGSVVIEHGDDQASAVLEVLRTAGFVQATSHGDLTGRARYVTAVWSDLAVSGLAGDPVAES